MELGVELSLIYKSRTNKPMFRKTLFDSWDQSSISEWKRIKANGKLHFMIYTGLLKAGLTMFMIFSFAFYFYSNGALYASVFDSVITIVVNLIASVCASLSFAHYYWSETEKSYNAFLKDSAQ